MNMYIPDYVGKVDVINNIIYSPVSFFYDDPNKKFLAFLPPNCDFDIIILDPKTDEQISLHSSDTEEIYSWGVISDPKLGDVFYISCSEPGKDQLNYIGKILENLVFGNNIFRLLKVY